MVPPFTAGEFVSITDKGNTLSSATVSRKLRPVDFNEVRTLRSSNLTPCHASQPGALECQQVLYDLHACSFGDVRLCGNPELLAD